MVPGYDERVSVGRDLRKPWRTGLTYTLAWVLFNPHARDAHFLCAPNVQPPSRGDFMSTTSSGPSRRTLVKGAAWSVPVAAVAGTAPAFAASPPVVPEFTGNFCKHSGNPKYYHNTMRWTNTNSSCTVTISLGQMTIDGDSRQAYASIGGQLVTSFQLAPNAVQCFYIDAGEFGNSQNGSASLAWTYSIDCPGQPPVTGTGGPATTPIGSDNDLPPCGTGSDPGNNPKSDPAHGAAPC